MPPKQRPKVKDYAYYHSTGNRNNESPESQLELVEAWRKERGLQGPPLFEQPRHYKSLEATRYYYKSEETPVSEMKYPGGPGKRGRTGTWERPNPSNDEEDSGAEAQEAHPPSPLVQCILARGVQIPIRT